LKVFGISLQNNPLILSANEMTQSSKGFLFYWRQDIAASVVVFLVALPLCLGIALASGAPLFSGLIAGLIGGIVVGALSKSPLSVSGPAAGLAVIVMQAIQSLPSYETFLLAVCLAGIMQIGFGFLRAGLIGDFIPSAVIKGMLAAIGLLLIIKQMPHAFGYDQVFEGDEKFFQADGNNSFSTIWHMIGHISGAAILISSLSLAFLFYWEKAQTRMTNWLRYVPASLIVVIFGVLVNWLFQIFAPAYALTNSHLVQVPLTWSMTDFVGHFTTPDFSQWHTRSVWGIAITIALVASVETLLSIEAIDKLDPHKRVTPTNRELIAQGVGNIISGLIGGLPITSVIVRSSANVSAGARTKLSAISHGVLMLICIILIPLLLNMIPLAALSAILMSVGYKLTKPQIYRTKFQKGWVQLTPFVVTIVAILFTDLLIGILIGCAVGIIFVMIENFRSSILFIADGKNCLLRSRKDLFFINKYELKKVLDSVPDGSNLLIDLARSTYIDYDNVELINDFMTNASYRDIKVTLKKNSDSPQAELILSPGAAAP